MTATDVQKKPSVVNRVLDALRDIFAPNLIALSAAGILQGITILLHTLGWIQEGKAEYIILDTISGAVFYFLPVLLANSAAKVFKTNNVLAMCAALFMLHPTIVGTFENNYVMADFFGVPLPPGNYPSSVIPIILIVWAQHYVEKLWNKIIPETIRGVFAPMLTLVTTCILGLSVLGPIGTYLGDLLVKVIDFLTSKANWLVPTILGGFGLFIVMTGAHYSLFPVVTQSIASVGYDSFFAPGMLASNMALAGAVAAVAVKTKNKDYRQYSISATVTSMLGVSQPGLYGVALNIKSAMVASVIGGLAGGLYAGLTKFYSYAFVNPGIAALPAFIAPDGSMGNLINGVITMVISFAVSFAVVFFGKYEDLSDELVADIVGDEV